MTSRLPPTLALVLPGLLFVAGWPSDATTPASSVGPAAESVPATLDWPRLAELLLERMALQPGERVLLLGAPGRFADLVPELRFRIAAAGAEDLGALSVTGDAPDGWATSFTESLRSLGRAELVPRLRDVDIALMLPGANPGHPAYAALQDVLREGRGRTIHFHWAGAYDLDGSLMAIDDRVDALYENVLLHTDYAALAEAQQGFEAAMRGATVRVTTPAGTDIRFEIGERPVTRQDGDASATRAAAGRNLIDREIELPAGAIRVAPVESSVHGVIAFPNSAWNGQKVVGLRLRFESGRVVDSAADAGLDAASAEMDRAGEAGRSFREFALGLNPLLAIPTTGDPWIPYYGYGAGVVRLSLGDNTELGGQVSGGYVRWNFFPDATVTIDDEIWVSDGRLVRD